MIGKERFVKFFELYEKISNLKLHLEEFISRYLFDLQLKLKGEIKNVAGSMGVDLFSYSIVPDFENRKIVIKIFVKDGISSRKERELKRRIIDCMSKFIDDEYLAVECNRLCFLGDGNVA